MRDIGSRIGRYRLTRYARGPGGRPRWIPWALAALALWTLWATAVSDHSLYRIWRLRRERAETQVELDRVRHDDAALETQLDGPGARRRIAEKRLREESGMAKPGEIVYRIRGDAADSSGRRSP